MLKTNPDVFWGEFRSRTGKIITNLPDTIDDNHGPQSIADMFASKFSAITGSECSHDNNSMQYMTNENDFSASLTPGELRDAIDKIKPGTGPDEIQVNHLKYANNEVLEIICRLYNSCFIHGYVPKVMLKGTIKPRPKNKFGNMKDSSNYREIMNSSVFMKLLEYLILPKLSDHCKISRCQFGYRGRTSTTLAVATLKEVAQKYNNEGSAIYACFLDMSKAFERVDHEILLRKLTESTLPRYIVNCIRSLLKNAVAHVSCNSADSRAWNITKGVRQGGVLSAHLFSIYIDSILEEISKEPYGCYLGINRINIQAYADDIVIFCPSASGLRHLLAKFSSLACQHNLIVNSTKTKVMIIDKKMIPHRSPIFEFDRQQLEIVSSYKYLGIFISYNLKNHDDIKRLQASFNKKVGMFTRKFHATELGVKLKLFNTMCMDMFGMCLWWKTIGCAGLLKQFAVSYHYALKKILGFPKRSSNHYTCYLLNNMTFDHLLNHRILKFYKWLETCDSPCFLLNKYYLLNNSSLKRSLDYNFFEKYQIDDINHNDVDAIISRMFYVQHREEASWNLSMI